MYRRLRRSTVLLFKTTAWLIHCHYYYYYPVSCFLVLPITYPASFSSTAVPPSRELTLAPLFSTDASIADEEATLEDTIWKSYLDVMGNTLSSKRVLRKVKQEDVAFVQNYLLSREFLLDAPTPSSGHPMPGKNTTIIDDQTSSISSYRNAVKEQREIFKERYNFTSEQYDFLTRCIVYTGDNCAKHRVATALVVAWQKMKECGMVLREKSISTYMYGLMNTKDEVGAFNEVLIELATFHDLFYSPTEKTVTLRIKLLINLGEVEEAEEVLQALEDTNEGSEACRLRTYIPLLEHFCSLGDGNAILRLFRKMRRSPSVYFDDGTYALLLTSMAKFGFFGDKNTIQDALKYGFSVDGGPKLFDEIVTEMAQDILEMKEEAVELIKEVFRDQSSNGDTKVVCVGKVDIDKRTALCRTTGCKLRLFALDSVQRTHVYDNLLEMAISDYEAFTAKLQQKENSIREHRDPQFAFDEISKFSDWLNDREGDPFTVIVDGANVAYYGDSRVHLDQIDMVVQHLESMGENPLVVLPHKYTQQKIYLGHIRTNQLLSDDELQIIQRLSEAEQIYIVPHGCLDDYYWMLASVSEQSAVLQGRDLTVPVDNEDGRFPGMRPMLITNDKMRDHKLALLNPREFRRWASCFIVNYNIEASKERNSEDGKVELFPADFFSKEIQGNDHPNGKDVVWHIPVTEWTDCERFGMQLSST